MTIFWPLSHAASSSFNGTRVVLPAPGSATSTAHGPEDSASLNCEMMASTGNSMPPNKAAAAQMSSKLDGSQWDGLNFHF